MKLKHLIFLSFIAFSFILPKDNQYDVINLKQAFDNAKPINISEIADKIDYIRIETSDACLAGTNLKVYSDSRYLVATDRKQILLFDRLTGKFIRAIGQQGEGPNQFSRPLSVMPFNTETQTIYAIRSKKRYEYSLDGKLVGTREIPELVAEYANLDANTIAAFLPNFQGNEKNKIVTVDKSGAILKTFPNYLSAPLTEAFMVWNPDGFFYKLDKQLYFCELFNDTIFHVTANRLTPKYILSKGKYSPPYEMRTSTKFEPDKYFMIKGIFESPRYLFNIFGFNKKTYTALFDKLKKSTFVNDSGSDSGSGIINNSNGFVAINISSVNENNELIGTIDAFKIVKWFKDNPDKIKQLPQNLKDLQNVKETDNPVLVIANLKK
jgi:hypothetical protein